MPASPTRTTMGEMARWWWIAIALSALAGCPTLPTSESDDTGGTSRGTDERGEGPELPTTDTALDSNDTADLTMGGDETGLGGCPPTHACVPPPPPQWSGPVALLEGTASCPATYPLPQLTAFADLVAAPSRCACSCDAQSLCGPLVGTDLESACEFPTPVLSTTAFAATDRCHELPELAGDGLHLAFEPDPIATCAPQPSIAVAPTTWSRTLQLCGIEVASSGCGSTELCVPVPDDAAAVGPCVMRPGEHACPPEFPLAHVGWTGTLDDRTCSACECIAPDIPPSCSATVRLSAQPDCNDAQVADLEVGAFACVPTDGLALEYVRYTDVVAAPGCTPTGGEPVGSAQPADAVTICCAG